MCRRLRPVAVEADDFGIVRREAVEQRLLRDQHRGAGVREHERLPVGRVGRVDRDVGGSGLQDGEDRHHQLGHALHADPDEDVGTSAELLQAPGEPVRACVQLGVGQPAAAAFDRDRVRCPARLVRDELVQAPVRLRRHVGRVPLLEQVPLGGSEERQGADRAVRVGGDPFEQHLEVSGQALDRRRVEEVGRVLDGAAEAAVLALVRAEREVEAGGGPFGQRERRQGPSLDLDRRRRDVMREDDLEERRVAQISLGIERLHELLEGQLLVRVGAEGRLADAVEELRERHRSVELRAQDERVREEADQRHCLLVVAARDRRPDDDVLRTAVPVQERLEGGNKDHEQRDVAGARQRAQPLDERSRQGELELCPAIGLCRRAWVVGGQVEPLRRAASRSRQ